MAWKISIAVVSLAALALIYQKASLVLGKDVVTTPGSTPTTGPASDGPLQYSLKDIDGKDVDLASYKGKVVMIVNVASKCGFTPQYKSLEALYKKYEDKGFVILGFPANNFHGQEPGTDAEIKTFCTGKYEVTFPIFSKVSVAGDDQTPLYKFLTSPDTAGQFAGKISWNFNKFLVDRQGHLYARFASPTKPDSDEVVAAVEKGLAK